ncbi:hypothetical protein HPB50_001870 [Hyalomma asiaticum]|uniref:Uncharacterized protein n=1 Tax=Hyalomma asiaticum TaxID=266040 RepID=A0ACB7SSL8_HYAAI|nr:hypothetical protein HPB50_001870 [Hyalomma asiaticum]
MENFVAELQQLPAEVLAHMGDLRAFVDLVRLPPSQTQCSASNGEVCQINNRLHLCNEILFLIGMELREQRCGSLSLICQQSEVIVTPPTMVTLSLANVFLRWLLGTHVCITSLKLVDTAVRLQSPILLGELQENSSLKKLTVQCYDGNDSRNLIATLIPRFRSLEELHCFSMSTRIGPVVAAVSQLLRTTTCLTSLEFRAEFVQGWLPKTFIDALAANTTLTSLTLSPHCQSARELWEYVRSNRVLTSLTIDGYQADREDILDNALVYNRTLLTLNIGHLRGGETTVRFLTKVFAHCGSVKNLSIGMVQEEGASIPNAALKRCMEALGQNTSLEKIELPYALWGPNEWIAFLAYLPRNKHLKKLEVWHDDDQDYGTLLPVVEALERTESAARVSFGHCTSGWGVELMRSRAFSSIEIVGVESEQVEAFQEMPNLHHFTSVSLSVPHTFESLFPSLASYIRNTKACRELRLWVIGVQHPANTATTSPWVPLFESILVNTRYDEKNSGLVERAAAFQQTTSLNWYTANALEKVSRRPALVRELAEREGMAEDEVRSLIQSRLMSVKGLDDFMRLSGVVRDRVTCAPRPDGRRKQLNDLHEDCWRVLRRYLSFDDVTRA